MRRRSHRQAHLRAVRRPDCRRRQRKRRGRPCPSPSGGRPDACAGRVLHRRARRRTNHADRGSERRFPGRRRLVRQRGQDRPPRRPSRRDRNERSSQRRGRRSNGTRGARSIRRGPCHCRDGDRRPLGRIARETGRAGFCRPGDSRWSLVEATGNRSRTRPRDIIRNRAAKHAMNFARMHLAGRA